MKRLLFFAAIFSLYLTACNKTSGNPPSKTKNESTPHFVIALFDTGANGKSALRIDFIYRIIKDTVKYVSVDQSTQKKKLTRDTSYYIMITSPVLDSLKNKLHKVNGADSIRGDWFNIDRRRVLIDGGRVDSAILKYKQP